MRKIVLLLLMFFCCLGVENMRAQERYIADKVVAVVGNSAIMYSDVNEMAKQLVEYRRRQGYTSDRDPMNEALEDLLTQKLLYNQALIDSVEINTADITEAVDLEISSMIENFGSLGELEAFYNKPVFDVKEELRQKYTERRYAQTMQYQIMNKVKITPGEVERYYNQHRDSLPIIPEQYMYAQITKYPKSTREAKQRVRERLIELRERVINGERFDMLARMYSEDPGSALRGGEMESELEGLVEPFALALENLRPGQLSEVVETEFGFHVIQLIESTGNNYRFRHILLRPTFTVEELMEGTRILDSLAREIRKDELTFEKAALDNSDDTYSKQNGGLVTNHEILENYGYADTRYSQTKFYKEQLPAAEYNVLRTMRVGEVSNAFEGQDMRGNVLSKIVKLLNIIPAHPASLKEDYVDLESLALEDKQAKEFEKWLNEKIKSMYVRIDPEFRTGEFANPTWLK